MTRNGMRAHPRYALEIDASIQLGGRTVPARTRNVSRGGLAIVADQALPVGADVTVGLALVFDEESMSEPLPLHGRIIWCSPLAARTGGAYQLGLMFVGLRHEERSYIDMFLRFLRV